MSLAIEIVVDFMALKAADIYTLLRGSHAARLGGTAQCQLCGESVLLADVEELLRRYEPLHFDLEATDARVSYGHVRNNGLSLVHIERCVCDCTDADAWMAPWCQLQSFRHARVYDEDYDRWQNAEDPLEYTSAGRPYGHLPLRSNGLRPPLNRVVIDTSCNPGRRRLRAGYVEALGAVMWLGPKFWGLTGADRGQVLGAKRLQCREVPNGVLRVQAAQLPFTLESNESGTLQEQMRSLLFPSGGGGRSTEHVSDAKSPPQPLEQKSGWVPNDDV